MRYKLYTIINYLKNNGSLATLHKIYLILKRKIYQNRFVLYYYDIQEVKNIYFNSSDELYIEIKNRKSDISKLDISKFFVNNIRENIERNIEARFKKGSTVWFLKTQNNFIGFIWSIQKTPIKPYYFPLTDNEIYLFDNEIFKEYRGKGFNTVLINKVLVELKIRGFKRAFIATAIWNDAEINSLSKCRFKRLAIVKNYYLFKKNITIWYNQ